jgi:neutral ceramidase
MRYAGQIAWTLTFACGLLMRPAAIAAEPLEAGVAVVDITPLPGYRMCGYFYERLNTGTHDPLLAKAVVFKQGDVLAALVFCDLAQLAPEVSREARAIAEQLSSIPAGNISITATHSHTGPLYFGALRKHFHDRTVDKHGRDVHELVDYPTELTGRLVRAIVAAREDVKPVTLSAGVAHEDRLSFNRRFHMKSGPVVFNPGHLNPDIVRPAGPIDPQVGLIALTPQGAAQPSAAVVSFALHLDTVGGTLYAADFPFYLQNELRKIYGEVFVSLFGAGTCGDINHIDVTKKAAEGRRTTSQIGSLLAETVGRQIPKLARVDAPSLAVKHAVVEVPLQTYSPAEIAGAQLLMERVDDDKVPFLERVAAYKIMDLQQRGGRMMSLEVHAIRLSHKVAIVTLPGEVFVELGMAIKQASPFETTLVIELANDGPGYIPTRKAFSEGSYETVNSRVASGGGEQMVELAVRLLNELAGESKTPSP